MFPLARLLPIVLLCIVRTIQAAPAAGKVGEDTLDTAVSISPRDSSSLFPIQLPTPSLAPGPVAESSPSLSTTVPAIPLPLPSPETTNTNGSWTSSTKTGVVDETVIVTSTTTAEASTVTVPLFFPPETVTNTVIITLSPSLLISTTTATSIVVVTPSSSSPPPSPTTTRSSSTRVAPKPSPSPPSARLPNLDGLSVWTAPTQLKNLDSFNVTSPWGQKNLKVVTGVPSLASVSSEQRVSAAKVAVDSDSDDDEDEDAPRQRPLPPVTSWTPSSSALQLFYPAGSINPAQKPQGGAEFYASPLDISSARNVSLRFSVFFPVDFDWYAAKDKQTKALCADPRSVCDAAYGFSIGRGSFTWAAGAWTTVVQTVVLNTPGKQDGSFRDLLWPSTGKGSSTTKSTKRPATTVMASRTAPPPSPTTTMGDDPLGDILGPLLSEITHLIRRGGTKTQTASGLFTPPSSTLSPPLSVIAPTLPTLLSSSPITGYDTSYSGRVTGVGAPQPTPLERVVLGIGTSLTATPTPGSVSGIVGRSERADDDEDSDEQDNSEEQLGSDGGMGDGSFSVQATPQRKGNSIGFIGLFFSTFFGGHDEKYATPRDQYVWFKDFAMSLNE
ncbi:hypothetical protein EST38_g4031 [Candolleomyces aberdarensis]|uniref:Polysaccharide lyase 14 domain-containing protein n=1 Tax=Candolleomyces aberdarensis TaxID=2316362 RepID=A0A4Q2DRH4_9AGAR|nr:hypothetical protein EST38_g4031 [Candolleomyces aberdarensis]